MAKVNDPAYQEDRKAYLTNIFQQFGDLQFVLILNEASRNGPITLFAFVCFKDLETAKKAIKDVHKKEVDGQTI